MHDGYKVVVFTPAGREASLSILMTYLRRDRGLIDQVHLWENTDPEQGADLRYLQRLAAEEPDWIKLVPLPADRSRHNQRSFNIARFYGAQTDASTIYVRLDDDIVWIAPGALTRLVEARVANPDPPLIFAAVWNNAVMSHRWQQAGIIDLSHGEVENNCMSEVGWRSGEFAEFVHRRLLDIIGKGEVPSLLMPDFTIPIGDRFSINAFAFLGAECAGWGGRLPTDDEECWMSIELPKTTGRSHMVCGAAVASHYGYYVQRAHLDGTDIMERYRELAERLA